jgi:FkbM family methyltransferase
VLATDFARVVAVEPAPENAALLRQNTAHLPGVDVVEAALGSAPGETRVALVATQGVNSGQYAVGEIGRPVPMVTIDGLGLAGLGLIKLDLEGYELPALRGAVATLRRERPVVVVEDLGWERLHGLPVGGAAAFLRGLGYRVAARSGSDLILIPEG